MDECKPLPRNADGSHDAHGHPPDGHPLFNVASAGLTARVTLAATGPRRRALTRVPETGPLARDDAVFDAIPVGAGGLMLRVRDCGYKDKVSA